MKNAQEMINILLISLDEKFAKNVALQLANSLDMFIADTKELIEYDLSDSKEVLKTCGLEYLKKRERKVVVKVSQYENTILTIGIDLFKDYYECFENSFIIYIGRKQKYITKTINKIEYENYDEFIREKADMSVVLDKTSANNATQIIMQKMREILWILLKKR